MLRALLIDRFQLKVHVEQRMVPAYALRVAKGGLKLHKTDPADVFVGPVKGYNCLLTKSRRGLLEGQSCSMAHVAKDLEWPAGRIVVDQTGVQGLYDFSLHWTPEDVQGSSTVGNDGLHDESYPFFFKAVEQELGLKLEPTNTSIDVYVVDHAEQPSAN